MEQSYKIVSIQRTETPPGVEGSNWHGYVLAFAGTKTVHGYRQGSLKDVTTAVEELVEQLNERHWKKRDRDKKNK
jgi:hypothetical protein